MNAWSLARTLDPLPGRLWVDVETGSPSSSPASWGPRGAWPGVAGEGSWRERGRALSEGLTRGVPLCTTAAELADAARPGAGPEARRLYSAWEDVVDATRELRAAVSWPEQPDANAWLCWMHRRGSSGRAHHYSQLLLALTARPSSLWSAKILGERLFERQTPPFDFDALLRAQLTRAVLQETSDHVVEDVRGLPIARYVAAWLFLEGAGEDRAPEDWLNAAAAATRRTAGPVWTKACPSCGASTPRPRGRSGSPTNSPADGAMNRPLPLPHCPSPNASRLPWRSASTRPPTTSRCA